jgi:FkbM family methyltransferase
VSSLLRASLKRNGLANVRLHEFALGSEPATLELNIPDGKPGEATFTDRFTQTANKRTIDVPVKVLDELDVDLRSVAFLKIDVEGFEEQVFHGARRILTETPPGAIVFERNELVKGRAPDNAALLMLKEAGFSIFGIEKSLLTLKLTPYSDAISRDPSYHDFVAVAPTERGAAHLTRLKRYITT